MVNKIVYNRTPQKVVIFYIILYFNWGQNYNKMKDGGESRSVNIDSINSVHHRGNPL